MSGKLQYNKKSNKIRKKTNKMILRITKENSIIHVEVYAIAIYMLFIVT